MSQIRKRLLIAGLMLAGTLTILTLYLPNLRPDRSLSRPVEGTADIGGAFQLTDQSGNEVDERILMGHYSLVYFGFTYCPDICPATLQTVSQAIDQLPGQKSELILPVFITVDPERDTAELMADYLSNFHPNFVGLTGSVEQVKDAAAAYRVFFRKVPVGEDGDYTVDHTGYLYLMNRSGNYMEHFSSDVTVDTLSARLRNLL